MCNTMDVLGEKEVLSSVRLFIPVAFQQYLDLSRRCLNELTIFAVPAHVLGLST